MFEIIIIESLFIFREEKKRRRTQNHDAKLSNDEQKAVAYR